MRQGVLYRFACVASTFLLLLNLSAAASDKAKLRARDLGIPLDGTPGPLDAITDVAGVEVGHTTLISGAGRLVVGKGPVRTGVTAILPRGKGPMDPVFAGWFALNGNGEMTGTTWVEESGFLESPIMITNTNSVGIVRDAVTEWMVKRSKDFVPLPVVAETYDGLLNDTNGFHVKKEDAIAALNSAKSGPVAEGNVGGGTGMICYRFKGGIGTASRRLAQQDGGYTIGVLVQCNYGKRDQLIIAGVPVGKEIPDLRPCFATAEKPSREWVRELALRCEDKSTLQPQSRLEGMGSIIIVVATDAPLLPHQLQRVAKRTALGIGRMGGISENSSGDIMIAFSTANRGASKESGLANATMLANDEMNPIFNATVQATEEAIVNAMLAAETMTGADDLRISALPHDRLVQVLKKYNRFNMSGSR